MDYRKSHRKDIRKFFQGAGQKPVTSQKPEKEVSLTKIKNGKDKRKDDFILSSPNGKDVNGNKQSEKDVKKHDKQAKQSEKDMKKHDKQAKHRDRSKDTKKKKEVNTVDDEEVVLIDEDSVQEKPSKTNRNESRKHGNSDKKNVYESEAVIDIDDDSVPAKTDKNTRKEKGKHSDRKKKNSLDKSTSDKDEVDGETVSRGKKRKKQLSSEDDFDVQIYDDVDDDDEVVVKKSKNMKKKGKKIQKLLDSDSDEDPVPMEKKQRKSRKVVHIGGAEECVEEEVKPKKTFLDNFLGTPSPKKIQKPKVEPKTEEPKTAVSAMDFFGNATVHRVERKIIHVEPKTDKDGQKKIEECMDLDDVEMHSDDDFEKTLNQIDEVVLLSGTPAKPERNTTKEPTSLSSKLAGKAKLSTVSPEKKDKVLVPDTPVSKQPSPKKPKMEFVLHRTERKDDKSPTKPKESPTKPEYKSPPKNTPDKGGHKPGSAEKKISPAKPNSETPGSKGSGYRSYLNRAGPQALGSKEIPEGAENCLEGLTFVITGVLESFERDEAKTMVERYGGKVTGNVSKKTDYLVAGRDAGQSKLSKAESFKTKILEEDGLLDLIRTRPGKKSKYTIQAEESLKKEKSLDRTPSAKLESFKKETPSKTDSSSVVKTNHSQLDSQSELTDSQTNQLASSSKIQTNQSQPSLLWVDKYKPTQMKQIVGQNGDKSNAKKLLHWLNNWHKNQAAGVKPVTGKFFGKGGSEDGAGFKAALLSGPPGIGKTTTATVVCQEAGFSFVELNASDTRNAKSLKEVISQSVGNNSIVDYMGSGQSATHGHKHCLIMDEVDGMSGNEDRGGVQELVNLIKNTKIPIITMCNDRQHPKIRTLANYCFDLKFTRPRLEQIKAAVMSIAFKEGVKIPPPAVDEIIKAANQDMRQVIHNLAMWTAADKAVTYDQVKTDANSAKKDMKLGPFDVLRKVFSGGEETNKMTLNDKSDLFFHDYNIAPLFVQENYIHVMPYAARGNNTRHLSLLARTADSLCEGDVCEKKIRSGQSWGLLPLEAMFASVVPGEYMRGHLQQMIAFPSWLGKNSTTGKTERILQELRTHMGLKITGDKKSLNLDYLPFFRRTLTEPLVQRDTEGVQDVIQLMDNYDIVKDDFDNIMEITKYANSDDPLSQINPKTKAAFTRTYNKEVHMTPYSTGNLTKKKRGGGGAAAEEDYDLLGDGEDGGGVDEEEDTQDDDVEMDTMIKKKTKASSKAAETKSKGKGKAPAKDKKETKTKGKKK